MFVETKSSLDLTSVTIKVWLFIVVTAMLHLFIGYEIAGRLGLFIGFLMAVALNILVFFFGQTQLIGKMQARRLEGQDGWGLNELISSYANRAGVPTPAVYLMEHETPSAFAIGHTWRKSAVCVSTGLLQKFTPEEIEAVVAHQVCHIRRLDTFAFGVSSTIANSFTGLAQTLDLLWPVNWFRKTHKQRPFMTLLSPLAWMVIRLSVSDKNYYQNDDLAASLLGERSALASALWKLESYSQTGPLEIPPCTSHLFVVNPEGLKETNWFFLTHPKMESRLRRLVGYYPL
jgi:heat shock protein HtpX